MAARLAMAQSQLVADQLTAATGEPVELVEIVTDGDRSAAPVQQLGVGVFVSALREALHAKEIDFAVHSYKDLPTAPADGLTIAAVPAARRSARRAGDPGRFAAVRARRRASGSAPAPRGGSPSCSRSAAAWCACRCAATSTPGCARSPTARSTRSCWPPPGCAASVAPPRSPRFSTPMLMLPAPAQGALAVECRSGDHSLVELLGCLDDEHTRAAVIAERSLLATLEAGCSAPVAALAVVADNVDGAREIYLRGAVFSLDGRRAIRLTGTGTLTDAAEVGSRLAAELLAEGADQLLGEHA